MSRAKTVSPTSPILLVEDELVRFHNFAMACWNPEVHRDEDNQDVQTALTQLRSWEEDDPSERRNPPHIVAAIRLTICLGENVGLVLDRVPDVASLWKPEFDAIEQALNELTHKYQSGAEDYKASLESARSLAYQAKRMCKRLEAKVSGESGLPNETSVDTQGDEEYVLQRDDAKTLASVPAGSAAPSSPRQLAGEDQTPPPSKVSGKLSISDLAKHNGLSDREKEALGARLKRWRPTHCNGEWIEPERSYRLPRDPHYLYDPEAVRPLIEAILHKRNPS